MTRTKQFLSLAGAPLFLIGFNSGFIVLAVRDASIVAHLSWLALAIAASFALERVNPFVPAWNEDHDDTQSDHVHVIVNTALMHSGIALMPTFAATLGSLEIWPSALPFGVQVVLAILVADFGITVAHFWSHRIAMLWRFHAVHHSAPRLYGLNGIMKHPLHQLIETLSGTMPLLLVGMPQNVAAALAGAVGVQLLLQHSNANYTLGPFRAIVAGPETHRFHHRNGPGQDLVNFALFSHAWDWLLGTYYFNADATPRHSTRIGIGGRDAYPRPYLRQLVEPFTNGTGGESALR